MSVQVSISIDSNSSRVDAMSMMLRIEAAMQSALSITQASCPPKLASALQYAVFPGGHRLRPRLAITVAKACGDSDPAAADAAACAIEFLHCASLVHDDLPAFDDADLRRGKPTVHKVYGEPLAVLAGDALIVLAFETIARGATAHLDRMAGLVSIVAQAGGAPHGICAGQAWESEAMIPIADYHRAKTSSLFAAATSSGALAAGHDPVAWRTLGERLGCAYQVADDIRDAADTAEEMGKPAGQDAARGRPNAVKELGIQGAIHWLDQLIAEAVDAIPACPGQLALKAAIEREATAFLPAELHIRAA
jgi:geranylgeranyl diphosphate synthase, type II